MTFGLPHCKGNETDLVRAALEFSCEGAAGMDAA